MCSDQESPLVRTKRGSFGAVRIQTVFVSVNSTIGVPVGQKRLERHIELRGKRGSPAYGVPVLQISRGSAPHLTTASANPCCSPLFRRPLEAPLLHFLAEHR